MAIKKNHHHISFNTQTGAALLALVLIIVIASSYFLATKLNVNLTLTQQSEETGVALNIAKNALIGYALSYPDLVNVNDGPGYLPCPDGDNDGSTDVGGCSLSAGSSIGRFPYKTLESEDLRDGRGERLWYVVSDNFRNNPKMIPLNSETAGSSSGDMTVNGYTNIAAVIFAAGAPVNTQNRSVTNQNIFTHYIEATFFDSDGDSIIDRIDTATTDRFILLTKDELMQVVEKRVLGEVSRILVTYSNEYGAYPWLSTFVDPKTDAKRLRGSASNTSSATTLIDSSTDTDFVEWGVVNGDLLWNITDDSIGIVNSVMDSNTLSVSGLSLGTDNDFGGDDVYLIRSMSIANKYQGTATGGSIGVTLTDSSQDFEAIGVKEGDVIDNVSNATNFSSGVINSVSGATITVNSLKFTDGTDDTFTSGDKYQIRINMGVATAGSAGLILEDTNKDFMAINVSAGDIVENLTDSTRGIVMAITADQLTLSDPLGELSLDNNDIYSIARYSPNPNAYVREGLLSFHQFAEFFRSGFSVEWNFPEEIGTVANATVAVTTTGIAQAVYRDHVTAFVQTSSNTSGSITVDINDGACLWKHIDDIECYGAYSNASLLTSILNGVMTNKINNNNFRDSTKDFPAVGVKRGDKIQNMNDLSEGIVRNTYTGINVDRIRCSNIKRDKDGNSQAVLNINIGEPYRIDISTARLDSVATAPTLTTGDLTDLRVYDTGANFSDIEVGDIVENIGTNGIGKITAIGIDDTTFPCTVANPCTYFEYTRLNNGGGDRFIEDGEAYAIHHNYVSSREYQFRIKDEGFSEQQTVNETRKRTVCIGYEDVSSDPDCDGTATNTTMSHNMFNPIVTILDRDVNGVIVGTATVTVPVSAALGSIKVSNVEYYLSENNAEIPGWFLKNNWHSLIYLAYSVGDSPGGGMACTVSGGDCLTLTGGGTRDDNKRAMVISAGAAAETNLDVSCNLINFADDSVTVIQDRSTGSINAYYEGETCSEGDDEYGVLGVPPASTFDNLDITEKFNDQIRILETVP